MNDKPKGEMSIENEIDDIIEPQLVNEVGALGKVTITHVLSELEVCSQNLTHSHQEVVDLNKVSDTLDILQKACEDLRTLIRIETDAAALRKRFEDEEKEKA